MARSKNNAFSLRCPEEQKEKIRLIAAANRRSMNREIEVALAEYIANYERLHGPLDPDIEAVQLTLIE